MPRAGGYFIAIVLVLSGTHCAPPRPQSGKTAQSSVVSEAYRLMDQGENAKAYLMLEEYVQTHPDDAEARLLLASSLAGQVGIDLYKLHDSFADLLFKKSIADSILEKAAPANEKSLVVKKTEDEVLEELKNYRNSSIDRLFFKLDLSLVKARRAIEILNRFHTVGMENWPLLHEAIEILDGSPALKQHKDIAAYRLFLRIVYLKSILDLRVIKQFESPADSPNAWVCSFNVHEVLDALNWVATEFGDAVDDYFFIKSDADRSALVSISGWLSESVRILGALNLQPLPGSTAQMTALELIKKELKCDSPAT